MVSKRLGAGSTWLSSSAGAAYSYWTMSKTLFWGYEHVCAGEGSFANALKKQVGFSNSRIQK